MGKQIKIRVKKPWIAFPGSTLQQNYAESLVHGYLLWDITDQRNFDVKFCELSNPNPFITINWQGTTLSTVKFAKKNYKQSSRFRVFSKEQLSQKEVTDITLGLKSSMNALEVVFKTEQHYNRDVITTGATTVVKEDLRSSDVILRLLKEYHRNSKISNETWQNVSELVKGYISNVDNSEVTRNTKWSLKHLKFDNTLAYGEGNVINFDSAKGIVGIFGPNRSGKSSIVGTIMYALFNGTDRGSIKNLFVINTRKLHCYTRAVLNVNGTDYVIERQTTKSENKRGQINAATALNLFRIDDGEAIDLCGEQRSDTEKSIRKLIGSPEDFLLTSLSAQQDLESFILQGSTKRRQILSRFLDLDIFDKMYDMSKSDLNSSKSILNSLPDRDWDDLTTQHVNLIKECDKGIEEKNYFLDEASQKLARLRNDLHSYHDITPVSQSQVDDKIRRINVLEKDVLDITRQLDDCRSIETKNQDKIDKILILQKEHNVDELKKKLDAIRTLETLVVSMKHLYETELTTLKHQERSLKILDDVPCGDQYLSCKFLKDASSSKNDIGAQTNKVSSCLEKWKINNEALDVLKQENIVDKISKLEQVNALYVKLQLDSSKLRASIVQMEQSLVSLELNLSVDKNKLREFDEALKNEENVEVVSIRTEIDSLQSQIKRYDTEKMSLATERGRVQTLIDKHRQEKKQRNDALHKLTAYELVSLAFSKKGIPSIITASQLPLINSEIAKILQGIVDFTIELETNDDNDSMEIYINYGDSIRVVELCSGMEKMIASIAIRVALTNVSSLPKTDILIIDESFGALDESGVEACNRFLTSLKRYFKTIFVITHVEGVKDAADTIIEVMKVEKDSKVVFA